MLTPVPRVNIRVNLHVHTQLNVYALVNSHEKELG